MHERTDRLPTTAIAREGRAEELLRHASDVVLELGPDGRIIYVSDSVERGIGRSANSLTGLSFLEIVIPEDRELSLAGFQKVVETGDDLLIHVRVARRSGERIELETSVRSFVDREGRKRIVAVCRDITERTTRAAADRRRDAHHRAIAQSGTRPAAIAALDGRILFANRRFREVFGNQRTIGEIRKRVSEESRIIVDSAWDLVTHSKDAATGSCEFAYHHPDGTASWYSVTCEATQPEQESRRFALFFEDITQKKKIERAFRTLSSAVFDTKTETLRSMIVMLAEALEMDRMVLGVLGENPDEIQILAGWQDGNFLEVDSLLLEGLPDKGVCEGEPCIHPIGVCKLYPAVADQIGSNFESYAGFPIKRVDGRVIGVIGGYGRKAIRDTDLIHSLLSSFATHAGGGIDRQSLDAEIRAGQDRYDALALQSEDAFFEVDAETRILSASQQCLTLFGLDPDSLVGLGIEELFHPDDLPTADRFRDELAAGETASGGVLRIRQADGSWRRIESETRSFKAADGSRHALIRVRDLSHRQRDELGRELPYQIVQSGADLVFVCKPNLNLLFQNEAATRLVGSLTSHAGEDRMFSRLLTSADAERLRDEILPRISLTSPWSGELDIVGSRTGSPIPTEATIFLFQGTDEEAGTRLIITLRDLTERRSAEEALRHSELRLSQAQKMEAVGRLASGIAHDFNNLLTAIMGYGDLVLDELGSGHGARQDTVEILRAAERAGGLTRQLLAFSRRQVLQPICVDLNAVVADIDRMMRRLIGEDIELITLQDGELNRIIADPGQVEQVIVNLVVNARDAMSQGGQIQIETANVTTGEATRMASGFLAAGDYVVLSVTDSGVGMDEDVQSQIFEPFFTTKSAHEGTGLGLASVYGIVNQCGGQIDVESRLGCGTTFSTYWPAADVQTTDDEPSDQNDHPIGDETILLVEDSDSVRQLVQKTLEKSGYRVLAAESSTAALRHCSRHPGEIDLMLVDVVLPKTPGPEIAQRVVEMRPTTRVLFMSGFTDDTLTRNGLQPGATNLLEKPFTASAVLSRIRDLLDADDVPSDQARSATD